MKIHAFGDDALADHDAVALAAMVRSGEVSAAELTAAAVARAERVEPVLNAIVLPSCTHPVVGGADGLLAGVPTFIKDNTDVAGLPTANGSAAFTPAPAATNGAVTRQILSTGVTVLGKSSLPEFGFNATTEFADGEPTHNPWDPKFSSGASSGGAAALVAAGVVPIAHANDGGGSIRIPAACCGLVGLKPSRGRLVPRETSKRMPLDIVVDGVVSRSVRDTATFLAAAERYRRNPALPPLGLVRGPADRKLRIGLLVDAPTGFATDAETRAVVIEVARALEKQGHDVEPCTIPFDRSFVEDFLDYWGMLAFTVGITGRFLLSPTFDAAKMDGLSQGLRDRYRHALPRTPAVLRRLRKVRDAYAGMFTTHDLLLSPVLAHVTPQLGYLSPTVPFDELLDRLMAYVAFTPLNNAAGGPAIALPTGMSSTGLPIGVHLSAAHGDERTLLEVAFALESDKPWRRIQD